MSFPNLPQSFCIKVLDMDYDELRNNIEKLGNLLTADPELGELDILHELLARLEYELNERLRVWHESYERDDDFRRDNYFPAERTAWC